MDQNLLNLIISTVGSVLGNKISSYLDLEQNPTKEGIMSIISENYGSEISAEKASIEADKILNIITKNGGKISLGEGEYKGGGSSIKMGDGANIEMNGDAEIRMS